MVNTAEHYDIAIVGGGLTGTALALALAASPYRIALLEPSPPRTPAEDWDARIFAFTPGNVAWLRQLGGWGEPVRAEAVRTMRIRGDQGGHLQFDALEAGLPELAFIAENGRVQAALWQAISRQTNVHVIPARPEGVVWGEAGHTLLFADDLRLQADLLVGADGAHSWLRQQAGIALAEEDYGQSGVVANFATEKPHRGIAYQWFTGDAVLAYLPLPGRRISIVWSTPTEQVADRLAQPPEAFAEAVAEAGQHVLGKLEQLTPQAAFPLKRRRAAEWVRPGLVLIGDAAHTVHPLAGQGVNLGFRDCRLLAQRLAQGGNPGEIGRLRAYALRREEDVASMQVVTGGLKKLFSQHDNSFAWLRNSGLTLADGMGWLKQALIAHSVQ